MICYLLHTVIRKLNLAEIGLWSGAGLKTFREYFSKAHLYGYEYDQKFLDITRSLKLKNTTIDFIDVQTEEGIQQALQKTNVLFDIIIEDSTHVVEDQVRTIKCCTPFLNEGGILIIEDLLDDNRSHERFFEEVLEEVKDQYCYSSIIYPENKKIDSGNMHNEKLLVLIKK